MIIRQSDQAMKEVLNREGVTDPTTEQLEKTKKKAVEEFYALLFLYHVDCQKYGKEVEDMENDVLKKKKNPFPKDVSDASRLLLGWRNNFGGRSVWTKANDGVAFAMVSDDKEEQKKSGKKKEVKCYRCKKVGHYERECNKELPPKTPKSGTNMLIMDESSTEQEEEVDEEDEQYCENQEIEGDNQGNAEAGNSTTATES